MIYNPASAQTNSNSKDKFGLELVQSFEGAYSLLGPRKAHAPADNSPDKISK